MSDYKPEVGHRVRVVLEGTVIRQNNIDAIEFHLQTGDQAWERSAVVLSGAGASVERLPDPKPEWQPEDHVLAADGRVYRLRDNKMWFAVGEMFGRSESFVPRPLIPLVRGGKPWADAVGGAS